MTTPQPDIRSSLNTISILPEVSINFKDVKSGIKPLSTPSFELLPDENERLTALHF